MEVVILRNHVSQVLAVNLFLHEHISDSAFLSTCCVISNSLQLTLFFLLFQHLLAVVLFACNQAEMGKKKAFSNVINFHNLAFYYIK